MEEFLSTPSARRATYELRRENQQYKRFLSTPSARRATRQDSRQKLGHTISIHALREEGDGGILFRPVMAADDFYPRPPRGGRPIKFDSTNFTGSFLSTPSARRATWDPWYPFTSKDRFLSTPSARRATRKAFLNPLPQRNFYPRPPRGGRLRDKDAVPGKIVFLSTPSARRATYFNFFVLKSKNISIHALREEGDLRT